MVQPATLRDPKATGTEKSDHLPWLQRLAGDVVIAFTDAEVGTFY